MKAVAAMRAYQAVKEPLPHFERGWRLLEALPVAVEALETKDQILGR